MFFCSTRFTEERLRLEDESRTATVQVGSLDEVFWGSAGRKVESASV